VDSTKKPSLKGPLDRDFNESTIREIGGLVDLAIGTFCFVNLMNFGIFQWRQCG